MVTISNNKKIHQNISFAELYMDSLACNLLTMTMISSQSAAQTICQQCYATPVTSTTKIKQCPMR